MPKRRKDINAASAKMTSYRMRNATLGTHVQPRRRPGHANASSVNFSSTRRHQRAQRGYVNNVMPGAMGPSARSGYAGGLDFSPGQRRRSVAKRAGIAVLVIAVLAAVAIGVGAFTLFGNLDSKLSLKNSDAASALTAAKTGSAFYTLVVADLDEEGMPYSTDGPDAIALVRTDASSKAITVVAIPAEVQVALKDGKYYPLREAATRESDASLVSAVNSFADISINHVVKVDAEGIVELVDALGGIDVNLSEEVDDPRAGDIYLSAGEQHLDGRSALVVARGSNFADADQTQAANRNELLTQVSLAMLAGGKSGLVSLIDKVGDTFDTDMSSTDVLALADSLRGVSAPDVRFGLVPGYTTQDGSSSTYTVSNTAWSAMMQRVEAGENPTVAQEAATADAGSFDVTIRNGGGITGAASSMSEALSAKGFNIADTGNTDTSVYSETLVIYNSSDEQAAAQTVLNAMGVGRLVENTGSYSFNTDVLVILGKDWKPAT